MRSSIRWPIWYAVITDPSLPVGSTFEQFALLTVQKAEEMFGDDGRGIVTAAWEQAGVLAH